MNTSAFENSSLLHPVFWFSGSRRAAQTLLLAVTLLMFGGGSGAFAAEDSVVNINTASAEVLTQMLQGIGMAKARLIVEYRELHGPFERIEELQEVRGIGASTLDKNRAHIVLK